jgi:hypothetical protein
MGMRPARLAVGIGCRQNGVGDLDGTMGWGKIETGKDIDVGGEGAVRCVLNLEHGQPRDRERGESAGGRI